MNATARPLALDALHLSEDVPPATLAEARADGQALARLLSRERAAAAEFLLALSDFDRRRGWERLGHASLFAFLTRDLGLSKGGAFFRLTAARLLQRFPELLEPLGDGRLCITAVVELAKVLTRENQSEVLPRFFGLSSREAREVAVALAPREAPPGRTVVTMVARPAPELRLAAVEVAIDEVQSTEPHAGPTRPAPSPPPARQRAAPRDEVEPLTADLRRLHLTVTGGFLQKLASAREGLTHHGPAASVEETLEAALDLLLERQARRHALVKRPRSRPLADGVAETPPPNPRQIPAHVEREVRLRDGNRCQFPVDSGGVCGSTYRVELDHIVPVRLDGQATAPNLRCACAVHNAWAAEEALGPGVVRAARRRGRARQGRSP